jgi:SAM-dependent methyltransferase
MTFRYVGSELDLFSAAGNWKTYFASIIAPLIGRRVLEIGAGIGSNISYLHTLLLAGGAREWISVEPDPALARRIIERIPSAEISRVQVVVGTIEKVDSSRRFDTILYLDVLEHIADDKAELARAAQLLAADGNLVILAPAHQFLFSEFDATIGHYRRYDAASLAALTPPGCHLHKWFMLDSAGFFASPTNRVLLRSLLPSPREIAIWDKVLVPISRVVDVCTAHTFGKPIVAVWCRTDGILGIVDRKHCCAQQPR